MRHFRILLRRYPIAWWALMTVTSALTGLLVLTSLQRSQAAAERLGGLTPVPVAARALHAGSPLTSDDVTVKRWPRALLPDDTPVADLGGAVPNADLPAGTALTASLFADFKISGPAAMLRPGERGVAIPRDTTTPSLSVGDWVDLFAVTPERNRPAELLSSSARVIDVQPQSLTAAIDADHAAVIAGRQPDDLTAVLTSPTAADNGADTTASSP